MNDIKVSVIVPVYNPGESIVKCIHSLQNQTLKEIEMIFVDDCGTDGAMDIVKEAAKNDTRIHFLINMRNIGSGPSRNRGIDAAKGEYLSFIDPDDYVSEDFMEKLYKKGKSTDADISKGEVIKVIDGIIKAEKLTFNEVIRRGITEGRDLCFLFTYNHVAALYRRNWIIKSGARYGESNNAEDTTFLLRVCYGDPALTFVDTAYYYYVARHGSADSSFSKDTMKGHIISFREKIEFLTSHDCDSSEMHSYITRTIQRLLKTQSGYALIPDMGDAAADFLVELREYINSFPFAKYLGEKNRTIDVFLKYGFNITLDPFGSEWNRANFKDYYDVVSRVVNFICSYPELETEYGDYLRYAFEQAITHQDGKTLNERRRARTALLQQVQRIPHRDILTKDFVAMKLYIDFGVDLFGLRNTKTGKNIKGYLRKIRTIKSKR